MKALKYWVSGVATLVMLLSQTLSAQQQMPSAMPANWQTEWEKTIALGRGEGKLLIYSIVGPDVKKALTEPFKEKYGIDIQWVSGVGTELNQKIFSERRAGLYLGDLYVGGSTPPIVDLKPAGVLAPIKPLLILPEVLNAKAYYEGRLPFIDREGIYTLAHGLAVANVIAVNSEMVKSGEIKSYDDLLAARWKNNIVFGDPTIGGTTGEWFMVTALFTMTPDFHRHLAMQNPILTRDTRLHVEWVARGKYAIALAPYKERVAEFQKVGAPLKWVVPTGEQYLSASSTLSYLDRAPHPNAAKVFINWFLSKEGLAAWSRAAKMQSAREDVSTDFLPPEAIRKSSVRYFNTAREEVLLKSIDAKDLARGIYGPLLK